MSNPVDYNLDVLATSPEEINRIAVRLKEPSAELLDLVAKKNNCKPDEIAQSLTEMVGFEPARNLFYVDESVNKARQFKNSSNDRFTGILWSRIFEISAEFPNAVFLVEYYDMQASYSGKRVIRAGEVVQEIFDGDQQSQAQDWVLLNIFAPFVAEWDRGLPFGSLWTKWLEDAKKQLEELGRARSQDADGLTFNEITF